MVDPIQRRRYARLLRALATGRLTNDEYEDAVSETVDLRKDKAIREIYGIARSLYSDMHEHRLKGPYALTHELRREVAKWLLFLYSDLEFKAVFSKLEFWPFPNKAALETTTQNPIRYYCEQESLPSGINSFKSGRLRDDQVQNWTCHIQWISIFLGIVVIFFIEWREWHFSLHYFPEILFFALTVLLVVLFPTRDKPLKWWQIIISLAGLVCWVAIFILIMKLFGQF